MESEYRKLRELILKWIIDNPNRPVIEMIDEIKHKIGILSIGGYGSIGGLVQEGLEELVKMKLLRKDFAKCNYILIRNC